jgi:hypothetical protein
MPWTVSFAEEFEPEFDELPQEVQDAILARALLLEREGPSLSRPHADTLTGSKHANMKELRCSAADGVWRIAFAFDPIGRRYCLPAETSQVAARSASTSSLSPGPTNGSTAI